MPPVRPMIALLALLAVLSLTLAAGAARAEEARAQIGVAAQVRAVANLQWLAEAPRLRISTADIARGTVEIKDAAQVRISSNSRSGYTLEVQPRMSIFYGIIVNGMRLPAQLGAQGGSITQHWKEMTRSEDLQLRFAFQLAPGVEPGEYPLPVALSVRPIEAH